MNLAFLSPLALWGLALLAVPLVIHLISKRRARRVQFALMELLLRSQKRTARNIRLRQLLLLLLRTLLLMAAALAVARPVLLPETAATTKTTTPLVVVVVVDASASMHARAGASSSSTVFARAKNVALDVLRAEAHDTKTAAVACEAEPRELAAPTFDRGAVVRAVDGLQPGYSRASLPRCLDKAAAIARAVAGEGERRVVAVSDLAASAFAGERATADGAGVVVEWRPVAADPAPANHAVTSASLERVSTRTGAALAVSFEAASFGASAEVDADLFLADARTARISLPLDDGRIAKKQFHVALPDATGADVATPQPDIAVVSLAKDALPIDDSIVLPLDAGGALDVLVVDGAPQALPFQDEVFYLNNALESVRGGRSRIKSTVVGPEQVTAASVAGARVIVLANVARLEDRAAQALVEHVKAGAGLLVSMGDQVDVDWYNKALADVLPSPLRGSKGLALLDDANVAEVLSLARLRTEHPILAGLAGGPDQADVPGLARVRTQTLMLVEPRAENEAGTIARFSNGAPALLERTVEAGHVIAWLTSIDRDWSDLAIRPGYVPLVQQAVLYLGGALEDVGPRLVRVGETRRIRAPRDAVEIMVAQPDGNVVRVKANVGEAGSVAFTETTQPGLYLVSVRTDAGAERMVPAERFTVAIAAEESDLRAAPADLLTASVPKGAIARGASDDDGTVRLWPYLLIAAVALLLVEALLLRKSVA